MKPRCPKCGSTNLWDDNLWEGCNNCDYLSNGFTVVNTTTGERVGESLNRSHNIDQPTRKRWDDE